MVLAYWLTPMVAFHFTSEVRFFKFYMISNSPLKQHFKSDICSNELTMLTLHTSISPYSFDKKLSMLSACLLFAL